MKTILLILLPLISFCQHTYTYSVAAVTGATSYTWTLPSGWSGSSATNTIQATAGVNASSGNITVTANNSCGASIPQSITVTVNNGRLGNIIGDNLVCPNTMQFYSVAPVPGVINYNWFLPAGWIGTSSGNSISVTTGAAGGTISVSANNDCGTSAKKNLIVGLFGNDLPIGNINGSVTGTRGSVRTYFIIPPPGIMNYSWQVPPDWTIQGTSADYQVQTVLGSSGNVIVTVSNECRITSDTLNVTVNSSMCPLPSIIGCSITKRTNDILVNRTGFTNYTYSWKKNNVPQYRDTVINKIPKRIFFAGWGQTVSKTLYKVGDKLNVVVGSTNAQTTTKCYIPGECEIIY